MKKSIIKPQKFRVEKWLGGLQPFSAPVAGDGGQIAMLYEPGPKLELGNQLPDRTTTLFASCLMLWIGR